MKKPKYTRWTAAGGPGFGDRPKPIIGREKCGVQGCPCGTFRGRGSNTCFNVVSPPGVHPVHYCGHDIEEHQIVIG